MNESMRRILVEGAVAYGVSLDEDAVSLFETFSHLITEGNKRTNLIAARDLTRLTEYHLLDSLKMCSLLDLPLTGSIMDFGSGAGFPGIPLAIAFPACTFTLVESRKLRCEFLEHAVSAMSLTNVSVENANAARLSATFDGAFSSVVTRATTSLLRFVDIAGRFISEDGTLIAIKGDHVEEEISSFKQSLSAKVFNIVSTPPTAVTGVRDGSIIVSRPR